jgi:CubicO group peptidase (beta-lactamase class C family)
VSADILAESFQGTRANPAYGLTWWLNEAGYTVVQRNKVWYPIPSTPVLPDLIPDLIRAMGHGKQRLYIIPSTDIVIVRFGESEETGWSDREFLRLVFGQGT